MESSQQPVTDRRHHVNSLLMRESLLDKRYALCAVAWFPVFASSLRFSLFGAERKLSS